MSSQGQPRPSRPGSAAPVVRRRLGRDEAARRRSRRVGLAGFLLAAALPVVLWHDLVIEIAGSFQLEWTYLVSGWTPWVLMTLGLLCFIPVAVGELRDRDGRFYRAGTAAWSGWGVTLYILGFALATQVAQIADSFARG
jgi:hypothetical protein